MTAPDPASTDTTDRPVKTRRLRWLAPALVLLAWLMLGGPLGQFAGQLTDVQENDSASFLPASAESTQVAELEAAFASEDVIPAVVVYELDGRTATPQDVAAVAEDLSLIHISEPTRLC